MPGASRRVRASVLAWALSIASHSRTVADPPNCTADQLV
ncbi:hypothetical protein THTE_1187 [Thermogutta terrifontis]|uniref:Uncharacterized protein n=1 Tax=Thermogutta terrifontis TaxID=1331910 RepID=A0A286RCV6_9BACT|nr:hypothetical protein THTE_1187 [Thermogutta terrifontis]